MSPDERIRTLNEKILRSERNLFSIEKRILEYVLKTDVPLYLEQELEDVTRHLKDLREQLASLQSDSQTSLDPHEMAVKPSNESNPSPLLKLSPNITPNVKETVLSRIIKVFKNIAIAFLLFSGVVYTVFTLVDFFGTPKTLTTITPEPLRTTVLSLTEEPNFPVTQSSIQTNAPISTFIVTSDVTQDAIQSDYEGKLALPFDCPDERFFWLRSPVISPAIVGGFGEDPEYYRMFGLPGRQGILLKTDMGEPVTAAQSGKVNRVNVQGQSSEEGLYVRIRHEWTGQEYETIYTHLDTVAVQVDQYVLVGQQIGTAGSTGNVNGSHLGFSLRKFGATASRETTYPNDFVNPESYLRCQ